jgi:hypothetical protein
MAWLGLGVFYGGVITAIPLVTGVAEGVSEQKRLNAEAANETYMSKFYLDLSFTTDNSPSSLKNHVIVLTKDKVWAVPKDPESGDPLPLKSKDGTTWLPHPFTGFYIMYPDDERSPPERGLVSTISVDPPMLNWIYCHSQTCELRYGNRTTSIEHVVGPWNWTEGEEAITLDGWEGLVVVDEGERDDGLRWAVYYDRWDDDFGGNGKKIGGRKRFECSLERRLLPEELRKAQEEAAEKKMSVKTTGDMSSKFEEPRGSSKK